MSLISVLGPMPRMARPLVKWSRNATRYGHLSRVDVVVGQEVKRDQIIGEVGMTGRATGPHLHYEVHVHDTPVNPAKYMHG